MKEDLLSKLLLAENYFTSSKYKSTVVEAIRLFYKGENKDAKELLDQLPTEESLLKDLIESLKGKSVYKTLKRILKGETLEKYTTLKGMSSLLTHTVIECEKGKVEYAMLFPTIMNKINEIIYKT